MLMSNDPTPNIELDFYDGTQIIYSRITQHLEIRFPKRSLSLHLNYDLADVHTSYLSSISRMREYNIVKLNDHQAEMVDHVVPWLLTHLKHCLDKCLDECRATAGESVDTRTVVAVTKAMETLNASTSSEDSASSLNVTTSSIDSTNSPPESPREQMWSYKRVSERRRVT
jgi:hypothetical protein